MARYIDLRLDEYGYADPRFLVKLKGDFGATGEAELICNVLHVSDSLQIAVKDTSTFTVNGRIEERESASARRTVGSRYTFTPKGTQTVEQNEALSQSQAQLTKMPITLVFPPKKGQAGEHTIQLALPVAADWTGVLDVSIISSGKATKSPPVTLRRQRDWGLPAELPDVTGVRRRATYQAVADNAVTFYNDASEDAYGDKGAFADISTALEEASHFIFIAGWSFHPEMYLKRATTAPDPKHQIGQILIKKARASTASGDKPVLVAIHTWDHFGGKINDDPKNNNALKTLTTMAGGTLPSTLLWRSTERSGILKTHHQKFIVLDAPVDATNPSGRREIKVFFGGLDLSQGRFDWPDHEIDIGISSRDAFKSFHDWWNAEFEHDLMLPRQPWHDIHAQLVGPAAWNFVTEFVGRWMAGAPRFAALNGSDDKAKLVWNKYNDIFKDAGLNIVRPFERAQPPQNQQRIWTAQVYRSIQKNFWHKPSLRSTEKGYLPMLLNWNLHTKYEKSIHKAYLQAIKRAQKFIYIETQYFISARVVPEIERKTGGNRIPETIVDRIVERAKANQPFHVYVVLPMFPEGPPTSPKLRPVRYFQWQTIQWMIARLHVRLAELSIADNVKRRWTDYLSFYFLGNTSGKVNTDHSADLGRKERVARSNRYMIYVHSKLMIVDHQWAIIGSANLNERSLAGTVDSEICVGMWPSPGRTAQAETELRAFHRRLWDEHLGKQFVQHTLSQHANFFDNPEQAAVVKAVQDRASENLQVFLGQAGAGNFGMGHLMLWNPANQDFPSTVIPDSPGTGDEWLVQPTMRGPLFGVREEFFL